MALREVKALFKEVKALFKIDAQDTLALPLTCGTK